MIWCDVKGCRGISACKITKHDGSSVRLCFAHKEQVVAMIRERAPEIDIIDEVPTDRFANISLIREAVNAALLLLAWALYAAFLTALGVILVTHGFMLNDPTGMS